MYCPIFFLTHSVIADLNDLTASFAKNADEATKIELLVLTTEADAGDLNTQVAL